MNSLIENNQIFKFCKFRILHKKWIFELKLLADLSSALVASGLVKNAELLPHEANEKRDEVIQFKTKNRLSEKPSSVLSFPMKPKPKIIIPSIEDVIINRQTQPQITQLPREYPKYFKFSTASQSSDISYLYAEKKKNAPSSNDVELYDEEGNFNPKNSFKGSNIGKNQIASPAQYENMLNSLHQVTAKIESDVNLKKADKIAMQTDTYNTVLSEIVRQCAYECGAKGELLNQARDFMVAAAEQVPILTNKIKVQKETMQAVIETLQEENNTIKQNISTYETKLKEEETENRELNSMINLLKEQLGKSEKSMRSAQIKLNDHLQKFSEVSSSLADAMNKNQVLIEQNSHKTDTIQELTNDLDNYKQMLETERKRYDIAAAEVQNERRKSVDAVKKQKDAESLVEEYKKQIKVIPELADISTQTKGINAKQKHKKEIKIDKVFDEPVVKPPSHGDIGPRDTTSANQIIKNQEKLSKQLEALNDAGRLQIINIPAAGTEAIPKATSTSNFRTIAPQLSGTFILPSTSQIFPKMEFEKQKDGTTRVSFTPDYNDEESVSENQQSNELLVESRAKMTMAEIRKLKNQYQRVQESIGEHIAAMTMDDYKTMREIILLENKAFEANGENIVDAQSGNFSISDPFPQECRLFAHTIMDRIMHRVARDAAVDTKAVQTFVDKPVLVNAQTMCNNDSFFKGDEAVAFTQMLDPKYRDRPPKTFDWILKNLRNIFDEKMLKDTADEKEGRELMNMPSFVVAWSTRQFGLDYLAQQCCWDLENSARVHQSKSQEIEIFRRFLSEDLCKEELTFFLRTRRICMRSGLIFTTVNQKGGEKYSDTYLTAYYAVEITNKVLSKISKEEIDETIKQLKKHYVQKPAPTADPNLSYIRMIDLLNTLLVTFRSYQITQMRLISTRCVLKPLPSSMEFTKFLQSLFGAIKSPECSELYKLASNGRPDRAITIDDFEEMFEKRSILETSKSPQDGIIDEDSEESKRAIEEWENTLPDLDAIIELARPRMEEQDVANIVQNLNIEIDAAKACKICHDPVGLMSHIFSCTVWSQQLKWAIQPTNFAQMISTISEIRESLSTSRA